MHGFSEHLNQIFDSFLFWITELLHVFLRCKNEDNKTVTSKTAAKKIGCYEVTLNVWTGNSGAEHFYEKMGMKTKERTMEFIL